MNTTLVRHAINQGTGQVKTVVDVHRHGSAHMVGDGFPVRNLIPGDSVGERLSPFLLLDHAGST